MYSKSVKQAMLPRPHLSGDAYLIAFETWSKDWTWTGTGDKKRSLLLMGFASCLLFRSLDCICFLGNFGILDVVCDCAHEVLVLLLFAFFPRDCYSLCPGLCISVREETCRIRLPIPTRSLNLFLAVLQWPDPKICICNFQEMKWKLANQSVGTCDSKS